MLADHGMLSRLVRILASTHTLRMAATLEAKPNKSFDTAVSPSAPWPAGNPEEVRGGAIKRDVRAVLRVQLRAARHVSFPLTITARATSDGASSAALP